MPGGALGVGLNLALGADIRIVHPAAKRVLNNSGLVDVATGLAEEASAMQGLLGTPNQLEAISAQFEGRPPKFLD